MSLMININSNPSVNAIQVNQLSFNYGNTKVLNHINASIPSGKIYSLLGSSGCGKTTLLRCIMRRLKPDQGVIQIFGQSHPTVSSSLIGYMPQFIPIIESFTVQDVLTYFGRLNQMKNEKIKQRMDQLLSLLHLESEFNAKSMMLSNLSGGQLRRVALSIALLHEPRILILDEPTVGVDPLLRMQIWNHLENLCAQEGVTVLLTTHYSEEARMSDRIGYIRNGRMLVEESTDNLLKTSSNNESQTLEEVFLRLSNEEDENLKKKLTLELNDEQKIEEIEVTHVVLETESHNEMVGSLDQVFFHLNHQEIKNKMNETFSCFKSKPEFNIDLVLILLSRYLIFAKRNILTILLWFILPSLILILVLILIHGNPRRLKIAVSNEEIKHEPNQILYSNLFLEVLTQDKQTFITNHFPTLEDAVQSVMNGQSLLAIHFEADFTNSTNIARSLGIRTPDDVLKDSQIKLHVDNTNYYLSTFINHQLGRSFKEFSRMIRVIKEGTNGSKSDKESGHKISEEIGLEVVENIFSETRQSLKDFSLPGVLIVFFYCLPMVVTTVMMIVDKESGLHEFILISGANNLQIFASQIIFSSIIITIEDFLFVFTLIFIMKVAIEGSFVLIFLLLLVQGLVAIFIASMVSLVRNDVNTGILLSTSIFFLFPLVDGIFWPIEGMPDWLYHASLFLPQNLSLEAMRSIIFRGKDLLDPSVIAGFTSSFAWIFTSLIICMFVLKKNPAK